MILQSEIFSTTPSEPKLWVSYRILGKFTTPHRYPCCRIEVPPLFVRHHRKERHSNPETRESLSKDPDSR